MIEIPDSRVNTCSKPVREARWAHLVQDKRIPSVVPVGIRANQTEKNQLYRFCEEEAGVYGLYEYDTIN